MNMKTLLIAMAAAAVTVQAGEFTLLRSDTLNIPVAQYRTVRFDVAREMSLDACLNGSLLITPDTSAVELMLFHADDYHRWSGNGAGVDTLAYTRASSGLFGMGIPGLGNYALVISNRGNYRPVSVIVGLSLDYSDSGPSDPLPAALKFALLLIAAGAAAFAIGSVLIKLGKGR